MVSAKAGFNYNIDFKIKIDLSRPDMFAKDLEE